MQILPFTKKKQLTLCSLCTAQMGNLQTNSSWSWMRHWQSLNAPQTIWVWLQLTTGANEFPRWDSGARQTNLETADNNRVIMLLLHRRLQDAPISTTHWVKRANNSRLHSLCKCHFAWNCNTWATALHLLQDYTHTHIPLLYPTRPESFTTGNVLCSNRSVWVPDFDFV